MKFGISKKWFQAIAEPSEDKADKEDAIDYSILIEALKVTKINVKTNKIPVLKHSILREKFVKKNLVNVINYTKRQWKKFN